MIILYAEDDYDDRTLMQHALERIELQCDLRFVAHGEEALDYLLQRGRFVQADAPRPEIILLDLNMPRKNGLEVLSEIKSNPTLRQIPVVVWTSSKREADVRSCYDCGATAYVKKPNTFRGLVESLQTLGEWWLETAPLPPAQELCLATSKARNQHGPIGETGSVVVPAGHPDRIVCV